MMYRNNALQAVFCLIIIIAAFVSGRSQSVLSLDSVLQRIERVHPALRVSEARIRELDTYATGTVSLPPPRVSSGLWMAPYNLRRWSKQEAHGEEGMGSFMISGEQMLPNRNMQEAEGRYMASMSGMQAAEKGVMRNMLFAEAKAAYYNWLVLSKKIAVLEENKNVLRLMLESARERYTYNREKLGSIYKAESELADLERMQAMYVGEIQRQKTILDALLLFPSGTEYAVDTVFYSFFLKNPPVSPDSARIVLRSEFRAIEAGLRSARLEQEWQRAKLRPEFGIRYDHMFAFGGQPWQFSLMGMMTVPIAPWANKDIKTRIRGIDHRIEAFEWEKAALLNTVRSAAAERAVMMQTLQNQLLRYDETIIPRQRKRFQSTLLAYEQNTDELFMVLDAWLELKTSSLAQLDLLQQLFNTRIEYEKELEFR